jgi:hypothetical protein
MKFKCINCKGLGYKMKSFIDTVNSIYRLIPENCGKCNSQGYIGFVKWIREWVGNKKRRE